MGHQLLRSFGLICVLAGAIGMGCAWTTGGERPDPVASVPDNSTAHAPPASAASDMVVQELARMQTYYGDLMKRMLDMHEQMQLMREEVRDLKGTVDELSRAPAVVPAADRSASQPFADDMEQFSDLMPPEPEVVQPVRDPVEVMNEAFTSFEQGAAPSEVAEAMRPYSEEAARRLLLVIGDVHSAYRDRAAEVLVLLDRAVVLPLLCNALDDRRLRIRALRLIGVMGGEQERELLRPLLRAPSPGVRLAAAESLADLGCLDGVPVLIDLLRGRDNVHFALAFNVLARITNNTFGGRPYESNPEVRSRVADGFEEWWAGMRAALHESDREQGRTGG